MNQTYDFNIYNMKLELEPIHAIRYVQILCRGHILKYFFFSYQCTLINFTQFFASGTLVTITFKCTKYLGMPRHAPQRPIFRCFNAKVVKILIFLKIFSNNFLGKGAIKMLVFYYLSRPPPPPQIRPQQFFLLFRYYVFGCQGVKTFLLKDPFRVFFLHYKLRFVIIQVLSQCEFLSFVTI